MATKKRESRTALARGKRAMLVEFTVEQKEKIQEAAEAKGIKPSQFVRLYAVDAAEKYFAKKEK